MKKILAAFILMITGMVSAQAQVFVGGNVGLWCDNSGEHNRTTWTIAPEIGYKLNKQWAIGAEIGFSGGHLEDYKGDNAFAFNFAPYARYGFYSAGMVDFFLDMTLGVAHGNTSGDGMYTDATGWNNKEAAFYIGFRPGIQVNLNKNWSVISKIGFLGYSANDHHVFGAYRPGFGFSFSNALSLGLYYNF